MTRLKRKFYTYNAFLSFGEATQLEASLIDIQRFSKIPARFRRALPGGIEGVFGLAGVSCDKGMDGGKIRFELFADTAEEVDWQIDQFREFAKMVGATFPGQVVVKDAEALDLEGGISPILVCSTGNISYEDAMILSSEDFPYHVAERTDEAGMVVSVPNMGDFLENEGKLSGLGVSDAFNLILSAASKRGIRYILFDRDADYIPGARVFCW